MDPSYDKAKTSAHQLALRVTVGRDEGKVFPLVEGFIGKVTYMTTRIARARISAPSEPMKAGMKVFSGLQPETLALTSERLSSIDKGL